MSETHPVLCNDERYQQKFILDKRASQDEDKAFHDTCVVSTQLNPILQNNYDETLAILQSQHLAFRAIAKKTRMPTLFCRPKILSAEILSRERKCCDHMLYQTEKPAGQKMPGSFTNANIPIRKEDVKERNVSQPFHKDKKCEFVVYGMNFKTDICHEMVSAGGISGTKSQVLDYLDKSITPAEEVPKRRLVFVDYIPISKPVKMYTLDDGLSYQDSSLPVNRYSAINESTKGRAIRKGRSYVNQDASNKEAFLDKTSQDDMESSRYGHPFSSEDDSEISSTTVSTLSSRCFRTEVDTGFQPHEGEEPPFTVSPSRVISIPTAQSDASESNRDRPLL